MPKMERATIEVGLNKALKIVRDIQGEDEADEAFVELEIAENALKLALRTLKLTVV